MTFQDYVNYFQLTKYLQLQYDEYDSNDLICELDMSEQTQSDKEYGEGCEV